MCQICVTDVRNDQWMLTEVVPYINNNGGQIQLSVFKYFMKLSGDSDWKCRLMLNGDEGIKRFCENSNGELTWATDVKGVVTVSTKFGQIEKQNSSENVPSTIITVTNKVCCCCFFPSYCFYLLVLVFVVYLMSG